MRWVSECKLDLIQVMEKSSGFFFSSKLCSAIGSAKLQGITWYIYIGSALDSMDFLIAECLGFAQCIIYV